VGTKTYADAFGDPGTDIFYPDQPESPRLNTNAGGRSVRFQADHHLLEMTSSHSQFGHTFDSWGHHLQVGNANHIYQEVIAQHYLERNPLLRLSDATLNLSDHGAAAEVFPITKNPEHQLLTDVGVITSACGLTAYLGGTFPPDYETATFVAEPVSNLGHVDQLVDKGVSFTAQRLFPHSEFLASSDPKFRPVNLYVGPDGALYVVDYYRQIIEHPEWMSEDVVTSGELYNDTDKGRIYRIQATGKQKAEWIKGLPLGNESTAGLVKHLYSPNSWWRMNAQRLLIDRADTSSIKLLRQTLRDNAAFVRLHALWTLEALYALDPDDIRVGLSDEEAGIRENAIKVAESHLEDPGITTSLLGMINDTDPKVRFQLMCTLGSLSSREAAQARSKLLFRDLADPWIQIAALTASALQPASLLRDVIDNYHNTQAHASLVQRLAAMAVIQENQTSVSLLIQRTTRSPFAPWAGPLLNGFADGLRHHDQPAIPLETARELSRTFLSTNAKPFRTGALRLLQAVQLTEASWIPDDARIAAGLAMDPRQPEDIRSDMVDFLTLADPSDYADTLMTLLAPEQALPIQLAVLRTVATIPTTALHTFLLTKWSTLTPGLREPTIRIFLDGEERMMMLLGAVETGTIQISEISWPRKVRLMNTSEPNVRTKARTLFTKDNDAEVNKAYQEALVLEGDAVRGQDIFQHQCGICHQIRGRDGIPLGPDLGTVHNWSKEAIMANILAPSQSISSGYDLWSVELVNEERFEGIISSETPGAITFRNNGVPERTVDRNEIRSLKALHMSAMPEGLSEQINIQQMADLLAFLKKNK
jgi:putative heme-binding domain-containing protein